MINSIGWYLDNLEQEFETYHGIRVGSIDLTPEEKKLFLGEENVCREEIGILL